MGIDPDKFTVLILSGGYGMGPIFEMVRYLNDPSMKISLIVICGHNKVLYNKIEKFKKDAAIQILNLGYVNNVSELMTVSDLYIGKAGGISTTEALVMGLPLVFVRPIPGQESNNARLVIKEGSAVMLKDVRGINAIVKELSSSPEALDGLRNSVKRIKKPNAARDIAAFVAEI